MMSFQIDGAGNYPSLLMAQLYAIDMHADDGGEHRISRDGQTVSIMYPEGSV